VTVLLVHVQVEICEYLEPKICMPVRQISASVHCTTPPSHASF